MKGRELALAVEQELGTRQISGEDGRARRIRLYVIINDEGRRSPIRLGPALGHVHYSGAGKIAR